ncbi:MAG: rRNA maturation RNase YbeY [Candidatus Puniceispirillaceae bacterium]
MTNTQTPAQTNIHKENAASGLCEESDSPADMPDPYDEWTSPAGHKFEHNLADRRWQPLLEAGRPICLALADNFARQMQLPAFEVSILWTDDTEMAGLNQQFRQKQGSTNILSFPASEELADNVPSASVSGRSVSSGPVFLGDMALSFDVLTKEAAQNGQKTEHHLAHLFLHGLLHLAGYDHQEEIEAEEMETLEIQLLSEVNIANPYDGDMNRNEGK